METINSSVECCLIISLNRLRCKHRPQIASRNDKVIGLGFWPKAFIYAALVELVSAGTLLRLTSLRVAEQNSMWRMREAWPKPELLAGV